MPVNLLASVEDTCEPKGFCKELCGGSTCWLHHCSAGPESSSARVPDHCNMCEA